MEVQREMMDCERATHRRRCLLCSSMASSGSGWALALLSGEGLPSPRTISKAGSLSEHHGVNMQTETEGRSRRWNIT